MELLRHYQNIHGAIRLAIYDGKFYMLGDVILNGYVGEIYGHSEGAKSQSSYTMRKVVVENNRVVSATGKISIFHVLATLGEEENTNENNNNDNNNQVPEENNYVQTIIKKDAETDIKLEASSNVITDNTKMEVAEITSDETLERIKNRLDEITKFKAFDITLKLDNEKVQPNGKVKIGIPIPEGFNPSKLIVYRIEEDNSRQEYKVTIENNYATFRTDHFSTYVLGESENVNNAISNDTNENSQQTNNNASNTKLPQTGMEVNIIAKWLTIAIPLMIFWLGSMLLIDKEKRKMMKK